MEQFVIQFSLVAIQNHSNDSVHCFKRMHAKNWTSFKHFGEPIVGFYPRALLSQGSDNAFVYTSTWSHGAGINKIWIIIIY